MPVGKASSERDEKKRIKPDGRSTGGRASDRVGGAEREGGGRGGVVEEGGEEEGVRGGKTKGGGGRRAKATKNEREKVGVHYI